MQKLWGRLLAGEVASPQSYSKRTLQFLKTLSKREAAAFERYCGFAVADSNGWHFIFDCELTHKEMAKRLITLILRRTSRTLDWSLHGSFTIYRHWTIRR